MNANLFFNGGVHYVSLGDLGTLEWQDPCLELMFITAWKFISSLTEVTTSIVA